MGLMIIGANDAGISAGLAARELTRRVEAELTGCGVHVHTGTVVMTIGRTEDRQRLDCGDGGVHDADLVLVVTGVRR